MRGWPERTRERCTCFPTCKGHPRIRERDGQPSPPGKEGNVRNLQKTDPDRRRAGEHDFPDPGADDPRGLGGHDNRKPHGEIIGGQHK